MTLETKRQLVHMGFGFSIFLFPWLDIIGVRIMLFALLLISVVVIPRLSIRNHLYRPKDFSSGFAIGALSYFGTLLVLSYVVSLPILAGAWALLAFGDGAATLYASHKPGLRLPWNSKKSYNGLAAFILIGFVTCFAAIMLANPMAIVSKVLIATAVATVVAAIVESAPIEIDDNISVALAGALVLTIVL